MTDLTTTWSWPPDVDLQVLRHGFTSHYARTPDAALFADRSRPMDAAIIALDARVAHRTATALARLTRLMREQFDELLELSYPRMRFANPALMEALRDGWRRRRSLTHLTTRFDMVPTPSGLRAFEINCGNICGLPGKGSNEAHVEVYRLIAAFRELLDGGGVRSPATPEAYRDYLIGRLAVRTDRHPLVWISDHGDNTEVFARFGLNAVDVRFPRDRARLNERDGWLLLDGRPVQFAYLDIGADEFHALGLDDPLVRAASGATAWISSIFESILLCEKLMMVPLTDEVVLRELVGADDAAAICDVLVPTEALHASNIRRVLDDPAAWVVKPSGLQGGDGVLIGADMSRAKWEECVRAAAAAGDHVLQPFLAPARLDILTQDGGKSMRRSGFYNVNPVFADDALVDWFGRYSFGRTVTWSRGGSCPVLLTHTVESNGGTA
jgi:hypothetical protein